MNTVESRANLWWPAPYPSSPLLLDLPPLFALLYFLFFLPLPLQFFRAKNKISSARALGKAALGLALARTDALNLQGFSASEKKQGGMEEWMVKLGKEMGGVEGGETCLYFLGIRRQMGALRGGLRSRPPWMAGKLTPIWLPGLVCALPACSPRTGQRPGLCPTTRPALNLVRLYLKTCIYSVKHNSSIVHVFCSFDH